MNTEEQAWFQEVHDTLIEKDLLWLFQFPKCERRDHIEGILRLSGKYFYRVIEGEGNVKEDA